MIKFFKGVAHEPNRRDTVTVLTSSVLFAVYLGALDWLFSWLTQKM